MLIVGLAPTGVLVLNPRNFTLLGPLFRYEMLRSSRQMRCFSLRCVYGVVLLVILYLVFASWFGWDGSERYKRVRNRLAGESSEFSINDMAEFGQTFAYACLWVQLGAAFVLTPILTAGTITEERGRRTLDFVLLTHLKDREIIVGKLAARLSHVALILLAGLPVLGLVQLLGGVDPNIVLAAFAATLLMMVSIGSVAIYNSTRSYNTPQAIFATFGMCFGYFIFSTTCWVIFSDLGIHWLDWIGDGNPLTVVIREYVGPPRGIRSYGVLESMVRFAAFHSFVALFFCIAATRRLRRHLDEPNRGLLRALRESLPKPSDSKMRDSSPSHVRRPAWPANAENLMWWKEISLAGTYRFRGWAAVLVACLLIFIWFLMCVPLVFSWASSGLKEEAGSFWARGVGTFASCMLLWSVAQNAARSITRERTRRTLDSLLATSLESRTILACKLFGPIALMRGTSFFLVLFWMLAVIFGSLSPLALPLLMLALTVLALMSASIGVWCSLLSRNTLRANMFTLAIVAGLCVLPPICGLAANIFHKASRAPHSVFSTIAQSLRGLSPPLMLWDLAFLDSSHLIEDASPSLLGLAVYGVAAWILWRRLNRRFGPITGRMPIDG
jgi:ABC-type Na+ efflux pump permease subunit